MGGTPEDKGSEKAKGKASEDRGETEVGRFEGDEHGFSPDVGHGDKQKEAGEKAMDARDTQAASRSEGGAIHAPEKSAEHVGESLTTRGETRGRKDEEEGRTEEGGRAPGRPKGKSEAEHASGVNPLPAKDDESEHLPPGDAGG
jgi:hypothetical protein